MVYTLKCILEFQDCEREIDCISCPVAKQYWADISLPGPIPTTIENEYVPVS